MNGTFDFSSLLGLQQPTGNLLADSIIQPGAIQQPNQSILSMLPMMMNNKPEDDVVKDNDQTSGKNGFGLGSILGLLGGII